MRLALHLLHSRDFVGFRAGLLVTVRGNRAPDIHYGASRTEACPPYGRRAARAARLARSCGATCSNTGIDDLSLSTNATRLHALAAPLKEAGVRRVNVSLDSLRADRVAAICGPGCSRKSWRGLRAAKDAGFTPIKSIWSRCVD